MSDAFFNGPRKVDLSVELYFKKVHPDAVIPQKQTHGSVGYDLYSVEEKYILPGEWEMISTGLKLANVKRLGTQNIPVDIQIRPRSGMAAKSGVTVLNSPGTVDPDYRGEMMVILINHGKGPYLVRKGDRIAQMVVAPFLNCGIDVVDDVSPTQRGEGGFGSTGK